MPPSIHIVKYSTVAMALVERRGVSRRDPVPVNDPCDPSPDDVFIASCTVLHRQRP